MLRAGARRLRIAFDLAETNFDKLNAKGMERVRRDVGRFLLSGSAKGPSAETGRVWVGSRVPALSDRELQTLLQLTVRRLLDALVARVPLNFPDLPRLDPGAQPGGRRQRCNGDRRRGQRERPLHVRTAAAAGPRRSRAGAGLSRVRRGVP